MKEKIDELQCCINECIEMLTSDKIEHPTRHVSFSLGKAWQMCENILEKLSHDDIPDPEDQIGE